jgi:tetratricopeptide (TPR) repeat protein
LENELGARREYRVLRADANHNLAHCLLRLGRVRAAEQPLRLAIALHSRFVEEYPHEPWERRKLGDWLGELAYLVLLSLERYEEAEAAFRKAIGIHGALADSYPENTGFRAALVVCLCSFAQFWNRIGQYEKALQELRNALEVDPEDPGLLNDLAWYLATCLDPNVRDPAGAVRLAQRALERAPQAAAIWNTLGVAQYRAGKWKAAVKTLEQSMALTSGGSAWDWLFLAMAHWRLGEKKQARVWYEKALAWIPNHAPDDAELAAVRTEAAALLVEPD